MTLLITGARGGLGREFARLAPQALTPSSSQLDVRDAGAVRAFVAENGVDSVIHCAAKTSVVDCEQNKADAFATNVGGTKNLCDALSAVAGPTRLTYISTACVFPGTDPEAVYTEDDLPHPKNYYALTKLLAEYVLSGWSACDPQRDSLIVRTNFAERGAWKHPKAFVDRFGTYLYPDLIAPEVLRLIESGATGLLHVCGNRRLSMYEFAQLSDPQVGEMHLSEYSGPPVTVNMSLGSSRIQPLTLA